MRNSRTLKIIIFAICTLFMICLFALSSIMDNRRIGSPHTSVSKTVEKTGFDFDTETMTYDGNGELDLLKGVTYNGKDAKDIADQLTVNVSTGDSLTKKVVTYKIKTEQGTDSAQRNLMLENYHLPTITVPELPTINRDTKDTLLEEVKTMEGFETDDGFGHDASSSVMADYKTGSLDSSVLQYTFTFVNACGDEASTSLETTLEDAEIRLILTQSSVTLEKGGSFEAFDYLDSCINSQGEDVSDQLEINGEVDTSKAGTYHVTYSIGDIQMPFTIHVND